MRFELSCKLDVHSVCTCRLYGALLKDFGFLSDGGFLETNGPAILGDHVGGTAATVKDLMKKARGKVLFIVSGHGLVVHSSIFM